MLLIFIPVTSVLSAQFGALIFPVGSLTVALIDGPHALILISIFVELDAKALFAVIAPVAYILLTGLPLLSLDCAILLLVLLLDPVDGAMRTIFLRFSVIAAAVPKSKTHKDGQLSAS